MSGCFYKIWFLLFGQLTSLLNSKTCEKQLIIEVKNTGGCKSTHKQTKVLDVKDYCSETNMTKGHGLLYDSCNGEAPSQPTVVLEN